MLCCYLSVVLNKGIPFEYAASCFRCWPKQVHWDETCQGSYQSVCVHLDRDASHWLGSAIGLSY